MKTLVIAEHDNSRLATATLNAVTAATRFGGDIDVLVAGQGCEGAVAQAQVLAGVSRVLKVEAAHYAEPLAESLAVLAQRVAGEGGYRAVLVGATSFGKNLAPRVAALLDVAAVSDVVAISAPGRYERPIYAGNVMVAVESDQPLDVLTVRTTAFDAAGNGGGAAAETVAAGPDLGLSRVLGRELSKSERPELASAAIVVSGGRGLGNGENYHRLLEPLADTLGRRAGRVARCRRCGLRAQRLPGRPDREDRCTGTVCGGRHLGCDPAPGRDEGLQGDRGDQQGSGCADLSGRRLRPGGGPVRNGAGADHEPVGRMNRRARGPSA